MIRGHIEYINFKGISMTRLTELTAKLLIILFFLTELLVSFIFSFFKIERKRGKINRIRSSAEKNFIDLI